MKTRAILTRPFKAFSSWMTCLLISHVRISKSSSSSCMASERVLSTTLKYSDQMRNRGRGKLPFLKKKEMEWKNITLFHVLVVIFCNRRRESGRWFIKDENYVKFHDFFSFLYVNIIYNPPNHYHRAPCLYIIPNCIDSCV